VDLIKLFLIFDKIKLKRNNIRKCIIENRNKIQGNYKGYIYCKEIAEAETIKKMINKIIAQEDIGVDNITLKHGCSEFYESYPEFKKINPNSEKQMKYDNEWKSFEEIIDSREPKRIDEDKKIFSKSIEGINLSDILIINNWISYAQIIGDESYKKVYDKKIENVFVNKFLEDQLEFRKKELKI
jgi:rubrerythrin